jgi:release factor glutamine methyltransferase
MTIKQTLTRAIEKLNNSDFTDSAHLDAELLLSNVLKRDKEFLYTRPETKLTLIQQLKFKALLKRRLAGTAVAVLRRRKEFYGYDFYVNRHVLVPRPLTEQMIDLALEEIKKQKTTLNAQYTICDIGTGSGNIIISLAKELEKKYSLDGFKLIGLDISNRALKVAKKNAKLHRLEKNIAFIKGNLLKPITKKLALNAKGGRVDLILANLPYLTKEDFNRENSIKKEPACALVGDLYPKLFKTIDSLKNKPVLIYEDKNGVHVKN